jgi:hypothetical protein
MRNALVSRRSGCSCSCCDRCRTATSDRTLCYEQYLTSFLARRWCWKQPEVQGDSTWIEQQSPPDARAAARAGPGKLTAAVRPSTAASKSWRISTTANQSSSEPGLQDTLTAAAAGFTHQPAHGSGALPAHRNNRSVQHVVLNLPLCLSTLCTGRWCVNQQCQCHSTAFGWLVTCAPLADVIMLLSAPARPASVKWADYP